MQSLQINQDLEKIRTRLVGAQRQLFEGLPRHVSPGRMVTSVVMALRDNPDLLRCEIPSLFAAIRKAAAYGWEIGGPLSQASLVPFRNNKTRTTECVLIPGYRGLIDLCRRSREVGQIDMELVREGDHFEYVLGDDAKIVHKPSPSPSRSLKPITHVYVIVELLSGGKQRSVWTREEIDAHKEQYARGWQREDSPWNVHWPTMAKKTVIVDLIKRGLLPISAEIRESVARDEPAYDTTEWTTVESAHEALEGPSADTGDAGSDADAGTEFDVADAEGLFLQLDSLQAINALAKELIQQHSGEFHRVINELAEENRKRVRSARGENSNKGGD